MDAPPPPYQHVITNLPNYPLYNPSIHRPFDPSPVPQSASNFSRAFMNATTVGAIVHAHAATSIAAPSSLTGQHPPSSSAPPCLSYSGHEETGESDAGGAETRRWSSAPVLSSGSVGAALPFSLGARSPTLTPVAALTIDVSRGPASYMVPASEEERRRRLVERSTDDSISVPSSFRALHSVSPVADAAAFRQCIESIPVQAIKWHWEPDDGTCAWIPYDSSLCQKIERHFQLWILATSTSCSICDSRRRNLPFDASVFESSFLHNFRPDVVWRFRFSVGYAGKILHLQVC
jgi:hypothetical protein